MQAVIVARIFAKILEIHYKNKQSIFCKMLKIKSNLRKVATIVACLAVSTMFASCDKNDDDDGNGGGKGRELTAEEKKLVGFWAGYPNRPIEEIREDWTWLEFKSDGTCTWQFNIREEVLGTFLARVRRSGNFKIEGNKIITSKVLETLKVLGAGQGYGYKDYQNKSVTDNLEWTFQFSDRHPQLTTPDGNNWLWVNHYPKTNNRWDGYALMK